MGLYASLRRVTGFAARPEQDPMGDRIALAVERDQGFVDDTWQIVPRPLTLDMALSVPAVRRGLNLIAGTIGGLPLVRWRGVTRLDAGYLDQPEAFRPYSVTMAATIRDLLTRRYAWWRVAARDWTGFPSSVIRLDPEYVSVQHVWGTDEVMSQQAQYKGVPVSPGDLICFEGPDEGLLFHGRAEILTALALEAAASRYAAPEMPTGVLQQNGSYGLTEPEIDALLDRWERSRRRHATAYLNEGVQYLPVVRSTAAEMQLVEAREECALQIARLLGLPPRYMAVTSGDSMTYSTLESERRDLVDLTLSPYINAVQGRLSMADRNGTPRGQEVKFSLHAFTRGEPLERAQRYNLLIPLGVMDAKEARLEEDLPGAITQLPPKELPELGPSQIPPQRPEIVPADQQGAIA